MHSGSYQIDDYSVLYVRSKISLIIIIITIIIIIIIIIFRKLMKSICARS